MSVVDRLPASPRDPHYRELVAEYTDLVTRGHEADAYALLAAQAEIDFWFFCRYVTSLSSYVIRDPEHPHVGQLYIEEPWLFDRCRDHQRDIEERNDNPFYNWPRYHLKTTLITVHGTTWETARDPATTTIILTYKVDQVGDTIFDGFRKELRHNPLYNACWPDIFPATEKDYPAFKTDQITVLRPPGVREPTVSIHGLNTLPTSFHASRIKVDDAEVRQTVNSQYSIKETWNAMRQVTSLRQADTLRFTIGTIWDANGPHMIACNEPGFFSRRDHWTCYGLPEDAQKKVPVLHSRKMIDTWRAEMGEYEFSCQLLGIPVAKGKQTLKEEWLQGCFYRKRPQDEAGERPILLIVDTSDEGEDYFVIYVIALGSDRIVYSIDLWRERYSLPEGIDLLFRLVKQWRPVMTYVEEFGASGVVQAIRSEQEARRYRFKVSSLPKIKTPKEKRIEIYGKAQERGEVYWPEDGFGHGSSADARDTWQQFREDEYTKWTPVKGSILFDDMLDTVAWPHQYEVKRLLPFPEEETPWGKKEEAPWHQKGELGGVSAWAF